MITNNWTVLIHSAMNKNDWTIYFTGAELKGSSSIAHSLQKNVSTPGSPRAFHFPSMIVLLVLPWRNVTTPGPWILKPVASGVRWARAANLLFHKSIKLTSVGELLPSWHCSKDQRLVLYSAALGVRLRAIITLTELQLASWKREYNAWTSIVCRATYPTLARILLRNLHF